MNERLDGVIGSDPPSVGAPTAQSPGGMLTRIAVLGNGQLGTALARLGGAQVEVLDRATLDLTDLDAIEPVLAQVRPDVVINAAAYNRVDEAEHRPDLAFAVNAIAAGRLARATALLGARLVHVSTDYVFAGTLDRPYLEDDPPGPLGIYGASKLAGEHLVRAYAVPSALIVRSSGVFGVSGGGGKGTNFVQSILRQATNGQPLRVVTDQTVSPTYAPDLARAILALVERGVSATVHVSNEGACTWYAFACAILELGGLDLPVEAIATEPGHDRARRPAYSVLDHTRLRAYGVEMPHWRDALACYLAEIGHSADAAASTAEVVRRDRT